MKSAPTAHRAGTFRDAVQGSDAARKHAAVGELIRRRPAPGCPLEGEAQMPAAWDEFTGDELSLALAESKGGAAGLLDLAWDLEVKLPGTKAAFADGTLRVSKARIIADAARTLDPDQARAAEALVLDRAGRLIPGGLRAAIARAAMQVAPEAARKRREEAAKDARLERWAEDSGNAPWPAGNCRPPRCWPPISGSPGGRRNCGRPGCPGRWTSFGPAPTWTPCSTRTPARPSGPAKTVQGTAADQVRRDRPGQTAGHPGEAQRPVRCRPDSPAG